MFRQQIELAEKSDPELWRKCFPRMYRDTNNFESPRVPAVVINGALKSMELGIVANHSDRKMYVVAEYLVDKNVPTFFIDRDLLQATAISDPPDEFRWAELKLPFEAALLMLPRGFLSFPSGDPVPYLIYGRIGAEKPIPQNIRSREAISLKEDFFMVFTTDSKGISYEQTLGINDAPFINTEPLFSDEKELDTRNFIITLSANENIFINNCLKLTFRLLLAIMARPALIESGKRVGRHKKSGAELWQPNIIGGKTYRAQIDEALESSQNSPRMHWRRGHYRRQAYGTGRMESKIIWIEPVLVGSRLGLG